jgi:hypothetical protein
VVLKLSPVMVLPSRAVGILVGWLFGYALWKHRGSFALLALVSGAYLAALASGQVTPLLVAASLIPALGFLLALLFNRFAYPHEQWHSVPHLMLYVVGFVAALGAHFAATRPAANLQQSLRDRIIPLVFGFVEKIDYRHAETPGSFHRVPREAIGTFDNESFDDVIAGRYEGSPFELYEATLSRRRSSRSTLDAEVFKGVVVSFHTINPFPGLLVATRKSNAAVGFLRGLFGGQLEELQSGVPALDKKYEFRTDNVEAARALVEGRLAQALEWLGEAWPERPARVALHERDGFLLIPLSRNLFELPGIAQPLDYKLHVEPMIADMAALLATASLVRKAGAGEGDGIAKE